MDYHILYAWIQDLFCQKKNKDKMTCGQGAKVPQLNGQTIQREWGNGLAIKEKIA